jgi:DNA excision repair protein ERCC-2
LVQERRQNKAEIDALLDELAAHSHAILFIVAGGILGESVDFTGISLHGVILVGLGLPPPSLHLDEIRAHFDAAEGVGWGQNVAYAQPALVKNIQAAGRLIRSPTDRGVICLVDERYARDEVSMFLPGAWVPQVAPANSVPGQIKAFWAAGAGDKPGNLN